MIENEILGRNRKALVIYGTGHFFSYPWPSTWPVPSAGTDTLGEIVERRHPGAFFFVTPYGGYKDPACSAAFEAEMNWPRRILVSPIRDTPLEEILMQPECITGLEDLDPPIPADELARLEQRFHEIDTGVAGQPMAPLAVTLPSWALPPQPWRRP